MEFSIGKKIFELRREKGLTQEALAEKMNVSAQAVSKWENDLSCPDVTALPKLAKLLGVTVDELLGADPEPEVRLVPAEEHDMSKLMLRICVDSADGDKVRVNLPLPLIKAALDIGLSMPQVTGSLGIGDSDALKSIDIVQILALVEKGAVGKLVEVESADGDTVSITVE